MTNGELLTSSIKIDRLRNKILEGEIKVPPFQRAFVWKKEQITELMDSIYNDYPIGSALLWEVNEKLPSMRDLAGYKLPDKAEEFPLSYILDGQQRITSIFGVFNEQIEIDDAEQTLIFNIYFDLDAEKFLHRDDLVDSNSNLKLSTLFNVTDFFTSVNQYPDNLKEKAIKLQSIFKNYEIPTVTIKKRNKGEVGTIFERINSTGTPLSALELMIAWTWSEEYDLKATFKSIYDVLESRDFGNIKEKLILQCFGAIINKTTITKEILELHPEDIRNNSTLLIKSLKKSLDYLQQEFNLVSGEFMPKAQILVPLSFLFSKIHRPTVQQSQIIKKWFWRVAFSDRYTSGTDSKMNDDIEFFEDILENNFDRIDRYSISINESFFKTQKLSKSNAFIKAVLLLLSKQEPLDLTNGDGIDTGLALSVYNKKEYHHIFPKAFLKNTIGLDDDKINVIGNYCFLPASSNKIISDRKPSDYFKTIIPQFRFKEILQSNLIPDDMTIYKSDNYQKFLDERSQLLMKKINEYTS